MKKLFLSVVALCVMLFVQAKDYADYVSPLVGTQSSFELSTGNTYPAIARPWGMNFWTPQTGKMGDGWQYVYTANKIRGFKQTHQPSPWINDYGQFSIMPVTGKPEFEEDKRASWFSHKAEIARPYYYKVYLAEHDVVTEMAPTERAVMFRFTFPENHSYVVVDAFDRGSSVKVIPGENKIVGYTTRNSGGVPATFTFEATFSNDIKPDKPDGSVPVTLKEGKLEQTGFHTGAVIGFKTKKGEVVHARVASSFISPEQAARNLKELGGDSFEVVVRRIAGLARPKWKVGTWTSIVLSIPACTVLCCSRANSMSWMPTGSRFIIALTMARHSLDICTPIQVSGIHSVACSLS